MTDFPQHPVVPTSEGFPVSKVAEARALASLGTSGSAIYQMVVTAIAEICDIARGGTILDVGCGAGLLRPFVQEKFSRYIGADAVRYDAYPNNQEFVLVELDSAHVPLPSCTADVVTAVETIEHLENPRAFVRELARLTKPGGWIVVTTPNQLSFTSKMTLCLKNQFNAFQEAPGLYPAHLTALLEVDLRRIAAEAGLDRATIAYSKSGRILLTSLSYPQFICRLFPRACSDNVLMMAQKRR